jgi:hypothetical protein
MSTPPWNSGKEIRSENRGTHQILKKKDALKVVLYLNTLLPSAQAIFKLSLYRNFLTLENWLHFPVGKKACLTLYKLFVKGYTGGNQRKINAL